VSWGVGGLCRLWTDWNGQYTELKLTNQSYRSVSLGLFRLEERGGILLWALVVMEETMDEANGMGREDAGQRLHHHRHLALAQLLVVSRGGEDGSRRRGRFLLTDL
jgi:hypothetical protein